MQNRLFMMFMSNYSQEVFIILFIFLFILINVLLNFWNGFEKSVFCNILLYWCIINAWINHFEDRVKNSWCSSLRLRMALYCLHISMNLCKVFEDPKRSEAVVTRSRPEAEAQGCFSSGGRWSFAEFCSGTEISSKAWRGKAKVTDQIWCFGFILRP